MLLPIGSMGSKLLPIDGKFGNPTPIIGGVGNKFWSNEGGNKSNCGIVSGNDPKFNVGGGGSIVFCNEGRLKDDNDGASGSETKQRLGGEGSIMLLKLGGEGSIMLLKLGGDGNIVLPKLGGKGNIVLPKLGGNGIRFTLLIEGGFNGLLLFAYEILHGNIFISKLLIVSIFNLGLSLIGF